MDPGAPPAPPRLELPPPFEPGKIDEDVSVPQEQSTIAEQTKRSFMRA